MRLIKINCWGFGCLTVVGDELNEGHDFHVSSNTGRDALDYLIFLDSRGVGGEYHGSLVDRLATKISLSGGRYLILCRPLELTTWATLVNFIALNNLKPAKIVTNMGFVDFTPKKQSILQNSIEQVEFLIGTGVAESRVSEVYILSNGEEVSLYSMTYSDVYRKSIEAIVVRQPTVIINTPIVAPTVTIQRKRPEAFFSALAHSNEFNRTISGALILDIPDFDERFTYDAVHYTERGNELIFDKIKDYL